MSPVTRDVVSDLWPLYASGEASGDTRALVDDFLAADPAFAATLRASSDTTITATAGPALPPGHDLVALDLTKRRLWGPGWLLRFALMFSCFAFARLVSDTSFDVSPRKFVITAAIALVFWIAFFAVLWRSRARILVTAARRT